MSTVDGPLGTTSSVSALDLRRPAYAARSRVSDATLGRLGLGAVLVSAVLLSVAAAHTDVLVPESTQPVVGPLVGVFSAISFHLQSGEVLGALGLMFIGYVLAVRHAEHLSPRLILSVIGVVVVVVVLAPPLFSTDIFSYQEYARMFFGPVHANPYTHGSGVLSLDPIYPYISPTWVATPTVYGPLFTLISGLFQNTSTTADIAFSAYAFKVIGGFSCLATVYMIWRCAKLRGVNPVRAVAIFGLNPLVVLYGVGGGHNDLLMMVFATAGVWAMLTGHERSSGGLTITAAAVKLTGAIYLPFALAAHSRQGTGVRRRRLAFGAAAALVVWAGVGLAIFGDGLTNMVHTLNQVQHEAGWQSVPGFFTQALNWPSMSHILSTCFVACFAVICLRLLWRVYRGDMDWVDASGWGAFWLLMASSSFQAWYISWLLVPLALSHSRRMWTATIWMCGWLQLTTMMSLLPHAPNILGF